MELDGFDRLSSAVEELLKTEEKICDQWLAKHMKMAEAANQESLKLTTDKGQIE
jgi:hypothetical protein